MQLVKHKIALAVTFSACVSYLLASGAADAYMLICATGIFLLAAGSGALNQLQEAKYDLMMTRTSNRPLPSGRIKKTPASILIALLIISGTSLLIHLSLAAAILGLLNIILYNLIYTPLKRFSCTAVLPGALVGALAPLIGFSAAGGSLTDQRIIYLACIVFLWQVPHFWLLLIKYSDEYKKAGFKTIMKHLDEQQVRRIAFTWMSTSSLLTSISFLFGISLNPVFLSLVLIFNLLFIYLFYNILFGPSGNTGKAFFISNIYFASFMLLVAGNALF